ncbi:hypothetical protein [Desulfogranum japonicum]|uniref:hypothetical protein n=1 Tax=Desulfogranum japonicum TaxID=231447 RepID=UPI0004186FA3|nr:hypothetical protein [Desulfogranum japonicum]
MIFPDFKICGTYTPPTRYKVEGILTIEGTAREFRRVVVADRQTLQILAATVTAADGSFSMAGLPAFGPVLVLGQDESGAYNGKCFDHVIMTAYPE